MMLEIKHTTKYTYEEDVILNPHILNLNLQFRNYYKVIDFNINIDPQPLGLSTLINLENTSYFQIWFKDATNFLNIDIHTTISTIAFNPLDFIVDNAFSKKESVFDYGIYLNPVLNAYTKHDYNFELNTLTNKFFQNSSDVISFINNINVYIHANWKHLIRIEEGFQDPLLTYTQQCGSCRDLALMMMEMLKGVGLATRYVSGYAYNPLLEDDHNLHAWIEVFIPGGGWLGVDPSLGLFTDYNYFPLAASFDPQNTLPVIGTFGGFSNSKLETSVTINSLNKDN